MNGSREATAKIERLLIVRLSAMGDVIHTLPAAQALREAFPNAMIGWLIEERWAELLCATGSAPRGPRSAQRPLIDWVHTVDLKRWRGSLLSMSTIQQMAKVWNDIRSVHYDAAIDLQGAIRSALLARWSGASAVYGASQPRESPASLWYSRQALARGRHVVDHYLSLAEAFSHRTLRAFPPELPRDPAAEARIGQMLTQHKIERFAILNPGAGWGAKRWPPERYGLLASALAENGVRSIINFGPGEEALAQEVETASQSAAMALRTSIGELIALTRRATLFIGGDTGPMHLAAALCVPVVAIFGPTDPARNGPYGAKSIVLRKPDSPTTHARHAQADEGLLEIGPDAVVHAARTLLASEMETPHG